MNGHQQGFGMGFTTGKTVKWLLIINGVLFLVHAIAFRFRIPLDAFFLIPSFAIKKGFIWEFFSYMFFHHPTNLFHIIFNMLILWMIGSELESVWGSKYFIKFYLGCGVGAALIYCFIDVLFFNGPSSVPVLGASGAMYGLLVAYGVIFSERVILFMMIFPMRAKYAMMVFGGIAVFSTFFSEGGGTGSSVAHAAHLGGLLMGLLILFVPKYIKLFKSPPAGPGSKEKKLFGFKSKKSHLKLVISEENPDLFSDEEEGGPKDDGDKPTWH